MASTSLPACLPVHTCITHQSPSSCSSPSPIGHPSVTIGTRPHRSTRLASVSTVAGRLKQARARSANIMLRKRGVPEGNRRLPPAQCLRGNVLDLVSRNDVSGARGGQLINHRSPSVHDLIAAPSSHL